MLAPYYSPLSAAKPTARVALPSHLSLHVASMTLALYYSRVALPYEVEARVALPYEGKARRRWRRCALRFALLAARSAAQVALPYYMWWCARRR